MNSQTNYKWVITEGLVDTASEHLKLSYQDEDLPYALLARGRGRTIVVQYFTGNKPWHFRIQQGLEAIKEEITYCIFGRKEANPWNYIVSRGTSPDSVNPQVHWHWYPDGINPLQEAEPAPEEKPDMQQLCQPEEPAFIQFQMGICHLQSDEYADAIRYFSRSIEIDNNNVRGFYRRAQAYRELYDYDNAISDYTQVLEIDPQFTVAYSDRGFCYLMKDEYDKALCDINKAIELEPENATYYFNRAFVDMEKEDSEAALQDFDKAIDLNPGEAIYYEAKGDACLQMNRPDIACQALEEALAINPLNLEVYAKIAQLKQPEPG